MKYNIIFRMNDDRMAKTIFNFFCKNSKNDYDNQVHRRNRNWRKNNILNRTKFRETYEVPDG